MAGIAGIWRLRQHPSANRHSMYRIISEIIPLQIFHRFPKLQRFWLVITILAVRRNFDVGIINAQIIAAFNIIIIAIIGWFSGGQCVAAVAFGDLRQLAARAAADKTFVGEAAL